MIIIEYIFTNVTKLVDILDYMISCEKNDIIIGKVEGHAG